MQNKKQMPRLRIKARITSKVREKDLIEKAKLLIEQPELILPECAGECRSCPFRKTRAHIERARKHKDDPGKLAGFARRGDRLARAYAATIGLVHEKKTPYLATATYPAGTITFALRGRTDKEKLIGVQNFDSPKWRVLSVLDLVRKKGLHFYSYGDRFVCTGRRPGPPEEYVELAAANAGASRREGDTYSCPHGSASARYLRFDWLSAGKKVVVCEQCGAKNKNTLSKLADGMAVPRVLDEFDVYVVRPLRGDKEACKGLFDRRVAPDLLEEYSSGRIGDKELMERHTDKVLESLRSEKRRLYVRGDRCFGEDANAFISELASDEVEKKALAALVEKIDHPILLEQTDSVNKLLGAYWSLHGREILEALVPREIAERFCADSDASRTPPLTIIRQALKQAEQEAAFSQMPAYGRLSRHGAFADEVVRAFKTGGTPRALAVLDEESSNDHRTRSMAYAFYLALGVPGKSWKFTDEEKEFGRHLEPFAKKLLSTRDAEEHHEAFAELLRQAGCAEELKRV